MIDLVFDIATNDENYYYRHKNRNCLGLESKLGEMYNSQCRVFSSGMEAVTTAIQYYTNDRIFIDENLYVETRFWLKYFCKYDLHIVNMQKNDWAEDIKPKDVVLLDYVTVFQSIIDLETLSNIIHSKGGIIIADNSISCIYHTNPLNKGADIVVESLSKYICGSGDAMGGVIATKEFDAKFDYFIEWRGRCVSPETCYRITKGLETFSLRMERINDNAQSLVKHIPTAKYCGHGGMFVIFTDKHNELCESLKIFKKLSTFGLTKSICTPSYKDDLYALNKSYIRLCCGIENKELLIEDVKRALKEVNLNEIWC